MSYYSGGYLKSITTPDYQGTTFFDYDGSNRLSAIRSYDGYKQFYGYDARGRLAYVVEKDGNNSDAYGRRFDFAYGTNYTVETTYKSGENYMSGLSGDSSDVRGTMLANSPEDVIEMKYNFDYYGRQISMYSADDNIAAAVYTPGNAEKKGQRNKVLFDGSYKGSTVNLLKNHSFESASTDWNYACYAEDGLTPSGSSDIYTINPNEGAKSLCIISNISQAQRVEYHQVFSKTGKVTVSFNVKHDNIVPPTSMDGGVGAFVTYTQNGQPHTIEGKYLTGSSDWQRYRYTFDIPSGATNISLHIGIVNASGMAFLDAVQLEEGEIDSKYNLLENSNLDYTQQDGLRGWDFWGNTSISAGDNGYGIKFGSVDMNDYVLEQTIPITAMEGDTLYFSMKAQLDRIYIPDKGIVVKATITYNDNSSFTGNVPILSFYEAEGDLSKGAVISTTSDNYNPNSPKAVKSIKLNIGFWNWGITSLGSATLLKDNARSYTYDDNGNMTSTKTNSLETKNSYTDNKLTSQINYTGLSTEYRYDTNGNLTEIYENAAMNHGYTYDSKGNQTSTSYYFSDSTVDTDNANLYQVSSVVDDFSGSQSNWRKVTGGIPVTTFMSIESDAGGNGKASSDVVKLPYSFNNGWYDYFVGYHMNGTPTPNRPAPNVAREATGISLWVRSNNATSLRLDFNTSYSTYSNTFSVNTDWQLVRIPFEDLKTSGGIAFNPMTASQYQNYLKFSVVSTAAQTGDIYVDDLTYYKGLSDTDTVWRYYDKKETTSTTYNSTDGTVQSSTDSRGYTSSNTYYTSGHQRGLVSSSTAPNGLITYYNYGNQRNRLTYLMAQPDGGVDAQVVVNYGYTGDNLTQITRNGFSYNFTYDTYGKMLQTKVGNQPLVTNSYEGNNGLLSSLTYGNSQSMNFSYDKFGRPTTKTTSSNHTYSYQYDGSGNIASIKRSGSGTTPRDQYFYYDLYSNLLETVTSALYLSDHTTRYLYDSMGRLGAVENRIGSTSNTVGYGYAAWAPSKVDKVFLNGVQQIGYSWDLSQRPQDRTITAANNYVTKYSYLTMGDKTTTMLSALQNGDNTLSYTYDSVGNITEIYENGVLQVRYAYDKLLQLTREDNKVQNKTITYSYDKGGNILSKKEYAFTLALSLTGLSYTQTATYGYDTTWKDLLTSYNSQTITYDAIGNPLTYRDGMSMTWKNGRQLATLSKTGLSAAFDYDDNGIRTLKQIGDEMTYYYLNGASIVRQETKDSNFQTISALDFFYDEAGDLFGFEYNGNKYYYIRNAQNDIIGILDSTGTQVVSYEYDTWGKLLGVSGSLASTIGELNPFRYRGYYYDSETGLYYLQSRYYDPDTGRFLNADAALGANGDILSYNLFTYCSNNPVNKMDPSGYGTITIDITLTKTYNFIGHSLNVVISFFVATALYSWNTFIWVFFFVCPGAYYTLLGLGAAVIGYIAGTVAQTLWNKVTSRYTVIRRTWSVWWIPNFNIKLKI